MIVIGGALFTSAHQLIGRNRKLQELSSALIVVVITGRHLIPVMRRAAKFNVPTCLSGAPSSERCVLQLRNHGKGMLHAWARPSCAPSLSSESII